MKELIYFPENELKPTGGPRGYLYNLNKGLEEIGEKSIFFLPPQKKTSNKNKIKEWIPYRLLQLKNAIRFSNLDKEKDPVMVDFSEYDIIHFHRTDDLYRCREQLEKYNGKIVLTSHAPCARHVELSNLLAPVDKKIFAKKLTGLEQMDAYAFRKADYVVFPCADAEEPYFHTWNNYENVRMEEKLRYLPTGIEKCVAKKTKNEVREKYGIPQDAFVVCYVGRHNEIKGYDIVKSVGKKLLQNENNYVMIAGKEEPLKGLNHDRWIEVGWTNDPHSIIAAADVFILPNRETYFDLIMLEVLSLGQIIVASRTGGNKYFEQFDCEGIQLYQTEKELEQKIKEIQNMSLQDRKKMMRANLDLYEKNFTVKTFAQKYVDLMRSL